MLVAAALLLVAYYLLKIFVRKKRSNKGAAPAAVPVAPAVVPAPVYTAEPEIVTESAVEVAEKSAENEN